MIESGYSMENYGRPLVNYDWESLEYIERKNDKVKYMIDFGCEM